jgi:hypothetical protein
VLAADSRITFSGGGNGHVDDQCKLFALGRSTIFAGSGFAGYDFAPGQKRASVDAYKEALRLSQSLTSPLPDRAKTMAERWAERIKTALDDGLAKHPREIISSLHGSSTLLASAVFAGVTEHGLSVQYVAINCECADRARQVSIHIREMKPFSDGLPAGTIGTSEAMGLYSELMEGATSRAHAERASWIAIDDGSDRDAQVTIRTGEFVLRNSKDRTIGGPINAIELSSDGEVRWAKREKNCQ